jgi:DNA-directed RNA polymerase specialized sigma subunit
MHIEGGETRRLTSEQQSLVSDPRHLKTASDVVARFSRRFAPLADEFESASLVALCEAAATFDESMGLSFSAHATSRLVGAMKDVCRNWTACGYRRSHEEAPTVSSLAMIINEGADGNTLSLGDTIPADHDPVGWEIESLDEVRGLSLRLPGHAGMAIRRMYSHADSLTMKDAGLAIGLSESRVSQLHSQAIEGLSCRFPDPKEIFMNGQALTYAEPKPTEAVVRPIKPTTPVTPVSPKVDSSPTEGKGRCPACKTPYGKRRRCYQCSPAKPPMAKTPEIPAIKECPVARTEPVVFASHPCVTSARQELRAIDEILAVAEKLEPESALHALLWVVERLTKSA